MKSKILILCFLGLFIRSNHVFCQEPESGTNRLEELNIDSIKSDFNDKFKLAEDMTNFKKLREYKSEKENLILKFDTKIKNISSDISELETDLTNLKSSFERLKEDVNNLKDTAKLSLSNYFNFKNAAKYLYAAGLAPDDRGNKEKLTQSIFRKIEELISSAAKQLITLNRKLKLLQANLQAAQTDLSLCLNTIDEALAPEYKELQTKIGLGYTVLGALGGVLLIFIIGIMFRKIPDDTLKIIISDGGLQFVLIFVLMTAIIFFGLFKILEGKELAAILAGISGYILGRGSRSLGDKNGSKKDDKKTGNGKAEISKGNKEKNNN